MFSYCSVNTFFKGLDFLTPRTHVLFFRMGRTYFKSLNSIPFAFVNNCIWTRSLWFFGFVSYEILRLLKEKLILNYLVFFFFFELGDYNLAQRLIKTNKRRIKNGDRVGDFWKLKLECLWRCAAIAKKRNELFMNKCYLYISSNSDALSTIKILGIDRDFRISRYYLWKELTRVAQDYLIQRFTILFRDSAL